MRRCPSKKLREYRSVDKVAKTREIWQNKREGGERMQLKYHMVTIEDLVPKEHLLRKVDAALDLSFVYEEVCKDFLYKF